MPLLLYVGKQLRLKVGRTLVALCGGRGIGDFAEGLACANASGAKDPGLWFWLLVRHGHVRKKPFADEPFDYFLAKK